MNFSRQVGDGRGRHQRLGLLAVRQVPGGGVAGRLPARAALRAHGAGRPVHFLLRRPSVRVLVARRPAGGVRRRGRPGHRLVVPAAARGGARPGPPLVGHRRRLRSIHLRLLQAGGGRLLGRRPRRHRRPQL